MGMVEPVQVSSVHAFAEVIRGGESAFIIIRSRTIVHEAMDNNYLIGTIHTRRSLVPQLCCPTLVRDFRKLAM